jgi:hypothetical protein
MPPLLEVVGLTLVGACTGPPPPVLELVGSPAPPEPDVDVVVAAVVGACVPVDGCSPGPPDEDGPVENTPDEVGPVEDADEVVEDPSVAFEDAGSVLVAFAGATAPECFFRVPPTPPPTAAAITASSSSPSSSRPAGRFPNGRAGRVSGFSDA